MRVKFMIHSAAQNEPLATVRAEYFTSDAFAAQYLKTLV